MIIIKQPKKTAPTYENKYVRFFYKNKCENQVIVLKLGFYTVVD